jgi:hypothetical protein
MFRFVFCFINSILPSLINILNMRIHKICVFCSLCLSLNIDKALYARDDHFRTFSQRMPRNIHHLRMMHRVTKKLTMKRHPDSPRCLCLSLNIDKALRRGGPFSRVFEKNAANHSSLAHGAESHKKVHNEEATRGQTESGQGLSSWGSKF